MFLVTYPMPTEIMKSQLGRKLAISDVNLQGKRVLIRTDFNVPIQEGKITDNARIAASLPTIRYALDHGASNVILMSHLGRPDGQVNLAMSLKPVAFELSKLLELPVAFADDCVGPAVEKLCQKNKIVLLENLRFHLEEEGSAKDANGKKVSASAADIQAFRSALTSLGDVYVNDAFGTLHRPHSSIVGIDLLRVSGLLVKKELEYFSKLMSDDKISLAILGGAKVSDKILLIENLLPRIEKLVIGGAMAFTFLKVMKNLKIGSTLFDEPGSLIVPKICQKAKELGVEIILPVDWVITESFSNDGSSMVSQSDVPDNMLALDIGPKSSEIFAETVKNSKSILFNGPPGVFEFEKFSQGTKSLVEALVAACRAGSLVVVGGGDTAAACAKYCNVNDLSHVSTGGGASLELLEGKQLPGIVSLTNKD